MVPIERDTHDAFLYRQLEQLVEASQLQLELADVRSALRSQCVAHLTPDELAWLMTALAICRSAARRVIGRGWLSSDQFVSALLARTSDAPWCDTAPGGEATGSRADAGDRWGLPH